MSLLHRNVRVSVEAQSNRKTETWVFEGLQVEFEIERTLEKEPSLLTASVYNLKEDTRNALQQEAKRKIITFEAGYGDDLQRLFIGDLTSVTHRKEGPNMVTELEAGDGDKHSRNWIRKSFGKGAPLKVVVRALITAAGMKIPKNLNQILATYEGKSAPPHRFTNGITLHGYAVDELYEILNGRGIEFSIQDNEIQLLPLDGVLPRGQLVVLSADSGLVGTPSLRVETVGNENSNRRREVLEATCLLVPGVAPGAEVYVEGVNIKDGIFRVDRATYRGSVFGSEFVIDIEGTRVS